MDTFAILVLWIASAFFSYLCGREHSTCKQLDFMTKKIANTDLDEFFATELVKRCMQDPEGRMMITEMLKKMRERAGVQKENKDCQQEY